MPEENSDVSSRERENESYLITVNLAKKCCNVEQADSNKMVLNTKNDSMMVRYFFYFYCYFVA